MMENGTAILTDFDKNMYTASPAIIQKIAVRVPDWNIPHITNPPVIKKNNLSLLNFEVMPKMIKATAAAAA